MGKKSSPPPPDYAGAAQAQGKSSREVTAMQNYANRPDQYTPWGSFTWDTDTFKDPATGKKVTTWDQNVNLSPELQAALDAQIEVQGGRSQQAADMLGRMGDEFGDVMDWSQFTEIGDPTMYRQESEDAMYDKLASRLDPMWDQREEAFDTQLQNQGFVPGTEAYDTAYANLTRERTDAYEQAALDSILYGGQEAQRDYTMTAQARQQQIAEEMQRRGFTLNEINALLTGQQVGMPSQPSFSMASKAEPTQYLTAAQNQHQANMDQFSSSQAGLQGLMSGAASVAPFFMSDRRLKKNITKLGELASGLGVYIFDYVWGDTMIGVMADEVEKVFPDAVATHSSGYKMVDYSRIA